MAIQVVRKGLAYPAVSTHIKPKNSMLRRAFPSILALFLLFALCFRLFFQWKFADLDEIGKSSPEQKDNSSGTFEWSAVTPNESLFYHDCFENFKCARLSVPLDWNSTGDERRVAVAVIKLPARVSVVDERYGGAILINPGGPGASGVEYTISQGKKIQLVADSEDDLVQSSMTTGHKYFDIIGFDPRGINITTPSFCCFGPSVSRQDLALAYIDGNLLNSSDHVFGECWANMLALSESCSQSIRENRTNTEISSFMNTAVVAEDIVAIVEQHGKWREAEAQRLSTTDPKQIEHTGLFQRISWKRNDEDILWWGWSYGTTIGATLAAMHPHRVQRMVLDGVNEANGWYDGSQRLRYMADADAVMESFFRYCIEAGPDHCPFGSGYKDSAALEQRLKDLLEDIKEQPIAVTASESHGPDVITYSDVLRMVFWALYTPMKTFPRMANVLADLAQGNGSAFADMKQQTPKAGPPPYLKEDCGMVEHAAAAILCTDTPDATNLTRHNYEEEYEIVSNVSWWTANLAVPSHMICAGWQDKPKWKYPGPIQGNTKHPILFAGNTYDPVGPLSGAYRISEKFNGSVVLEQLAEGHCTSSSLSACTKGIIRKYWQTGELPAPGTKCEVAEKPFGLGGGKMSEADRKLLDTYGNGIDIPGGIGGLRDPFAW